MAKIDSIYKDLVNTIINEGKRAPGHPRAHYADGEPAYTREIFGVNFKIKPEDGLPILQSKRIAMKSFKAEIDWIWRLMSNDVRFLQELGSPVWNEWMQKDGSVGKSYGYQLANKGYVMDVKKDWLDFNSKNHGHSDTEGNWNMMSTKLNQVEYVLHEIINNPSSRRIITNLYEVGDLQEMVLFPCVFMTNWQVTSDNKLDLIVTQRSADVALGLPSNLFEYSLLHHRIAQVTGKEVGTLHWNVFNAHIYERHIDLLSEQVNADISELENTRAKFILPESLDYFGTSLRDIQVVDYVHNGNYKYEIAI